MNEHAAEFHILTALVYSISPPHEGQIRHFGGTFLKMT